MKTKKNVTLKISLIVLAVLAAVAGVLFFMKSRVQPPRKIELVNQYDNNLQQLIAQLSSVEEAQLEQEYQLLRERIQLMKEEEMITADDYSNRWMEFLNQYVPRFSAWCENRFLKHVWPKEDLQFMRDRIAELQPDNLIINDDNQQKINVVKSVLSDYDKVWKLRDVRITCCDDSRKNLDEAKQYKQHRYLSYCDTVMDFLNQLPDIYKAKHHTHINTLLISLNFSSYSVDKIQKWGGYYQNAYVAVRDYIGNSSAIYTGPYQSDSFSRVLEIRKNNAMSKFCCSIENLGWPEYDDDQIEEYKNQYRAIFGSYSRYNCERSNNAW